MLVDGENVRRSRWPNLERERLVELCHAWGEREGHDVRVVWETAESADDAIARKAQRLRDEGREVWLATSDRQLRARAAADRTIGGGAFLAELLG